MTAKKYKVIAKVGNEKFVKYNVTNLVLFSKFLDQEFPDWRFFNVFAYTKDESGPQIANYTRNNRPSTSKVP
jgi:hypothetical protein